MIPPSLYFKILNANCLDGENRANWERVGMGEMDMGES